MGKKISDLDADVELLAEHITNRRRKTKPTMRVHGARTRALSGLIVRRGKASEKPIKK